MVSFGESYVVFYLLPIILGKEQLLKLKIFPPYNLENPDVVVC